MGSLSLGGMEPVRVQSMTNTSTMDVESTYRQINELYEAGCEMARMTCRNLTEADKLGQIRNMLEREGIFIPLVADIHFNPHVAEKAAGIVHKVRINPGNYLDQQYYLSKDPDNGGQVLSEEERRESIGRLVDICRRNNTAIRVGVNHGSLSKRILHRYGNTPEGMIASAIEFLTICGDLDFHQLVVSMKSSHVNTMIRATIGVAEAMMEKGMDYPLHLGVTEAGEGQDGRIRSAAGIGPLLERGLGDTIRVSLTEDPVAEIPVAQKLVKMYHGYKGSAGFAAGIDKKSTRKIASFGVFGNGMPPVVVGKNIVTANSETRPDLFPEGRSSLSDKEGKRYSFLALNDEMTLEEQFDKNTEPTTILVLNANRESTCHIRELYEKLVENNNPCPLIIKIPCDDEPENFLLEASGTISSLLYDGIGEGFWLSTEHEDQHHLNELIFGVLQATGARISGTEYISCPTCGRTNFDMQAALKEVKKHTSGLKNVRIAVMGCIVNGPGEMADADFGYVGEGKGKVSLYHQGKRVLKGIDEGNALKELLQLIREAGY